MMWEHEDMEDDKQQSAPRLPSIVETRLQMYETRLTMADTRVTRVEERLEKHDTIVQSLAIQGATIAETLRIMSEQFKQHGDEIKDLKKNDVDVGKIVEQHEQRLSFSRGLLNYGGGVLLAVIGGLIGHFVK